MTYAYWLFLLCGLTTKHAIIARKNDLNEISIVQTSFECTIKEFDHIVAVKRWKTLASSLIIQHEIHQILAFNHSSVLTINPCEASIWLKIDSLSQNLSLLFNFLLLFRNQEKKFSEFRFEFTGESLEIVFLLDLSPISSCWACNLIIDLVVGASWSSGIYHVLTSIIWLVIRINWVLRWPILSRDRCKFTWSLLRGDLILHGRLHSIKLIIFITISPWPINLSILLPLPSLQRSLASVPRFGKFGRFAHSRLRLSNKWRWSLPLFGWWGCPYLWHELRLDDLLSCWGWDHHCISDNISIVPEITILLLLVHSVLVKSVLIILLLLLQRLLVERVLVALHFADGFFVVTSDTVFWPLKRLMLNLKLHSFYNQLI